MEEGEDIFLDKDIFERFRFLGDIGFRDYGFREEAEPGEFFRFEDIVLKGGDDNLCIFKE